MLYAETGITQSIGKVMVNEFRQLVLNVKSISVSASGSESVDISTELLFGVKNVFQWRI